MVTRSEQIRIGFDIYKKEIGTEPKQSLSNFIDKLISCYKSSKSQVATSQQAKSTLTEQLFIALPQLKKAKTMQ